MQLLQELEQSNNEAVALTRVVLDSGCFRALLHPSDAFHGFNYAVPLEGANSPDLAAAALPGLREVFAAHGRELRFEFTRELWPNLPGVLERAGLRLESEDPLMLLGPDDFRAQRVAGVDVQVLHPEDDDAVLAAFLETQSAGFGYPKVVSADEIAVQRVGLRRGRAGALAHMAGQPVGAASTVSSAGVAELAGVSTLPGWRRRGVASAVSSVLCERHFVDGGRWVWLSAGGPEAQACYARLGFRVLGARVNWS